MTSPAPSPPRLVDLRFPVLLLLVTTCAVAAQADDWTQWRGPSHDGSAPMFEPPEAWPEALERVWVVEVGEGQSLPVVAHGLVLAFARQGNDEILRALRLADGEEVWRRSWPAPYVMNQAATAFGKGPKSTPAATRGVEGGHDGIVCVLGVAGRLSCHQTDDGEELWSRATDVSTRGPFYGTSTSPRIEGGVLYVHLGDDRGGTFLAADARGGEERWTWTGAGPSYATPLFVDVDGGRQIVTLTLDDLVGLDAATGELLWRRPFADRWKQNIVSPVRIGAESILFADLENGTLAAWPVRGEDGWRLEERWTNAELTQYMATPVVADGLVFGLHDKQKGQIFALDPADGSVEWRSEGRQGENASLVAAGPWLLVTTTEGKLHVVRATDQAFRVEASYEIASSAVWSHPAWVGDGFVVKDVRSLIRWRFRATAAAEVPSATPGAR